MNTEFYNTIFKVRKCDSTYERWNVLLHTENVVCAWHVWEQSGRFLPRRQWRSSCGWSETSIMVSCWVHDLFLLKKLVENKSILCIFWIAFEVSNDYCLVLLLQHQHFDFVYIWTITFSLSLRTLKLVEHVSRFSLIYLVSLFVNFRILKWVC